MSRGTSWETVAERGSLRALRSMTWFLRTFGRRASLWILHPIVLYFWLSGRSARRASRGYLDTLQASPEGRDALQRAGGTPSTYRHIYEFGVNILDRLVAWGGAFDLLHVEHAPLSDRYFGAGRDPRGAILIMSHLGSFDILRRAGRDYGLAVNFVMFTRHAERINDFIESLDPLGQVRILPLVPGSTRTAFAIRACIERGEFVAIPGDRSAPDKGERVFRTTFLGRPARFPASPFLLPGALGCPVLMTLAVRTGDGAYETVIRPLGDGRGVGRRDREKFAREILERYVRALEEECYRAPYQWFNFFDFWADAAEGDAP